MELANLGSTVSDDTLNWLKKCPNPHEVRELLEQYLWFKTTVRCGQCNEGYKREDMRYDEVTPGGNPEALICNMCWTIYDRNGGTIYDPNYRAPEWPRKLDVKKLPRSLINGDIVDKTTGEVIGYCSGYNYIGHAAQKVMLFAFPDCAESGTLDASCEVRLASPPLVFGDLVPDPLSSYDFNPETYSEEE